MNITQEQAKEIIELLGYVGDEVWGNTRKELDKRVSDIVLALVESAEKEQDEE